MGVRKGITYYGPQCQCMYLDQFEQNIEVGQSRRPRGGLFEGLGGIRVCPILVITVCRHVKVQAGIDAL